jgi:hypothetical protein
MRRGESLDFWIQDGETSIQGCCRQCVTTPDPKLGARSAFEYLEATFLNPPPGIKISYGSSIKWIQDESVQAWLLWIKVEDGSRGRFTEDEQFVIFSRNNGLS